MSGGGDPIATATAEGPVTFGQMLKTLRDTASESEGSFKAFGNEGMRQRARSLDATQIFIVTVLQHWHEIKPILDRAKRRAESNRR